MSDPHGNAVGLRAALDDLAGRGVDEIVCLGDLAQGGPQPAECLELVRSAGARTVLGNSDAFLLDPSSTEEQSTDRQLEVREWTLAQLPTAFIDLMGSFEPTVELELDGRRLLCFHGTPRSYDEPVLPHESPDSFAGTGADLLAGGHVHVPQLRRVRESVYVNPGSVGLGYDHLQPEDDFRFDPWASYAILERGSVDFRRVPFDAEQVIRATRASGIPYGEEGLWRWEPRPTGNA
jgi:predicted phosphodiesterase